MIGDLEKASLQPVENFTLTNNTYIQGWELLKEMCGTPKLLISTPLNEVINLIKVNGSIVTELRELHDRIKSNVRALKPVGIQQEHFGSLILPIILEKVPNVI